MVFSLLFHVHNTLKEKFQFLFRGEHWNADGFPAVCVVGVAELQRAGLESGDTEQIIQHLHRELLEAQEMANTGKQRCLELQGNK